jgi:hypothetical protein
MDRAVSGISTSWTATARHFRARSSSPQVFGGQLRKNAYELPESGFCSLAIHDSGSRRCRYWCLFAFRWLAGKVKRWRSTQRQTVESCSKVDGAVCPVINAVVPATGVIMMRVPASCHGFLTSVFFILRLATRMGMLPFSGAPTAAFANNISSGRV